jgi:hypothetical protein
MEVAMPGIGQQDISLILILLLPLVIGAVIAALNKDGLNSATEKIEAWIKKKKEVFSAKDGKISRFVIRPFLSIIIKFCDWTDSFAHRGLKNGVRVAATLYLAIIWSLLLYVALIVILGLIVFGVVIYVLFKFIFPSDDNEVTYVDRTQSYQRESERNSEFVTGVGIPGKKIYAGTKWFNEELKGRVDDQGNIYKGTSWLNEERMGRIDEDGNIYKGTGSMNEEKVGRIDSNGNIQKGANWFNEEKVGRIDDDGNIFKGTNVLNEEKVGKTER